MKKGLVWLLIVTMALGLLAGCSKDKEQASTEKENNSSAVTNTVGTDNTESSNDTTSEKEALEPVELTMYLLGDKPADFDLVYDEVNKN